MRLFHRFYAWLFGYFWLPCPRCGTMFGGHEKHGDGIVDSVEAVFDKSGRMLGAQGRGRATCRFCKGKP